MSKPMISGLSPLELARPLMSSAAVVITELAPMLMLVLESYPAPLKSSNIVVCETELPKCVVEPASAGTTGNEPSISSASSSARSFMI